MGEVYDRAAALDRPLADRWKTRTRENLNRELTRADIEFIMGPLFRGRGQITEKQGQALVVLLENQRQTRDGAQLARDLIEKADDADRLNRVALITDAQLADVRHALGNGVVGKILFKSPGTGITYAPFDYGAVCELIAKKRIPIFENKTGGLGRALSWRGRYNTDSNRLVLNEISDPVRRMVTIVHESTHIIQDWRDLPSLIHDEEADAHLADALATHALKGVLPTDDATNPVAAEVSVAAQLVLDKKAEERNPDWITAYSNLQRAIGAFTKKPGMRALVEKKSAEGETYRWERMAAETRQFFWDDLKKQLEWYEKNVPRPPG